MNHFLLAKVRIFGCALQLEKVLFLDEPLTIKYGGHDDQLSKKYWGMDRFRVKALEKLILNHELNLNKKVALKSLLAG